MENRVGLVAAMPEEIAPLLRVIGCVAQREILDGFPLYRFKNSGSDVILIRSGVGMKQAARATHALIKATAPHLIINFGFGGAVLPGPAVGEVLVATRILRLDREQCAQQEGLTPSVAMKIAAILEETGRKTRLHIDRGTFITTAQIMAKGEVAGLVGTTAGNLILEMESAAVAMVAADHGIPMAAVRGVSDDAEEELGFSIDEFVDQEMQISIRKVLWTLARKPWLIPQLIRLEKNARVTGERLATAILAIIEGLANITAGTRTP